MADLAATVLSHGPASPAETTMEVGDSMFDPTVPIIPLARREHLKRLRGNDDDEDDVNGRLVEYELTINEQRETIAKLTSTLDKVTEQNIVLKLALADMTLKVFNAKSSSEATPNKSQSSGGSQSRKSVASEEFPRLPEPTNNMSSASTPVGVQSIARPTNKAPLSFSTKKPVVSLPKTETFTVLISPPLPTTVRSSASDVKKLTGWLGRAILPLATKVQICKVRALNKGCFAVDTCSAAEQTVIINLINNSTDLGQGITARPATKFNPRLRIDGIRKEFVAADKDVILDDLLNYNKDLQQASADDIKVVTVLGSDKIPTAVVIIEVSPAIRSAIMKTKALSLGLASGVVSDHVFIKQCNRCYDFGHHVSQCTLSADTVCGKCSLEHSTSSCPTHAIANKANRANKGKCCASCLRHPLFKKDAHTHGAMESGICPSYKALIRRIQNNITYA